MKNLHRYIGRIIRVRPGVFGKFVEAARRKGHALENQFIVAAAHFRSGKLICYGSDACLRLSPADVVLI